MPLVHTLMRFIKVRYFVIEVTSQAGSTEGSDNMSRVLNLKINREGAEWTPHMQSGFDLCLDFTQDTWSEIAKKLSVKIKSTLLSPGLLFTKFSRIRCLFLNVKTY